MEDTHLTVAVDGPASSGKSTVAKLIAKKMNLIYIDTGAMYRGLTLKALETGTDLNSEEELSRLLDETEISFSISEGVQEVYLDKRNVTEEIRTTEVTNNVSVVSAHPKVRSEMVKRQRKLASTKGVIMDGRDIGTVVLPDASVKIFLNASVEERAKRRHEENLSKGFESDFDTLVKEIEKRDHIDSTRATAPLVKAQDAVAIDSTKLTIDEVVGRIEEIIKNRQ